MSGTISGGKRAAATNKQRYGNEFYRTIGRLGGLTSTGGGFTGSPERARLAGQKGGKVTIERHGTKYMEEARNIGKNRNTDRTLWRGFFQKDRSQGRQK